MAALPVDASHRQGQGGGGGPWPAGGLQLQVAQRVGAVRRPGAEHADARVRDGRPQVLAILILHAHVTRSQSIQSHLMVGDSMCCAVALVFVMAGPRFSLYSFCM